MKLEQVPTPAYVIDLAKLENKLSHSAICSRRSQVARFYFGPKEGYSLYKTYPLISQYLSGMTASGLYEAKLAREEFPGKSMYLRLLSRIQTWRNCWNIGPFVFNSERQLRKIWSTLSRGWYQCRFTPQPPVFYSGDHALYDPCAPGSRFGVTSDKIPSDLLDLVDVSFSYSLWARGRWFRDNLEKQ